MKKSSFLRKQLILSLVATCVLGVGSFLIAFRLSGPQPVPPPPSLGREGPEAAANERLAFLAQRLDGLRASMPDPEAVRLMDSSDRRPGPSGPRPPRPYFYVLDEQGQVTASSFQAPPLELEIDLAKLPAAAYEAGVFGKERPGPFAPRIVRLERAPVRYLLQMPGPRPPLVPTPVLYVIGASLLSVLLSSAMLVVYLRKNAMAVDNVLSQLQSGNLKARFPVKKLDEAGRMMTRFNEMADEIEKLVGRVRETEKARVNLLQELGHDLRTPLASLQNLLETFSHKRDQLTETQKTEIANISLNEVRYLARLVEDLLFLARVDDPRYLASGHPVDIKALLHDEVERIRVTYGEEGKSVAMADGTEAELRTYGDPHLLMRLFRNALENARSFARSGIRVIVKRDNGRRIAVYIEDDGPGFPPAALESFGEKRGVRFFSPEPGQRLSIGLGSVIMKAVAHAHGGGIRAENLSDGDTIFGARVTVTLPLHQG